MTYKVIFIDWFNTLSSSLFYDNCGEDDLCGYFRKHTFQDNEEMLEAWLVGKKSRVDVVSAFARNKSEQKKALSLLKKSCENMTFDRETYLPLIQKIRKKGVKVVIATDNMDVFTDYVVPALKLRNYFDEIISSNILGCQKMDIENGKLIFFDSFLKNNKISYSEALVIDDSFQTSISCQKCGLPVWPVKKAEDVEYILRKLAEEI